MTPIDDLIKRLRDYSSVVKAGAYNGNDDLRVTTLNEAADRLQAMKEALDDLIMAAELPGDHCELEPAIERARRALKGE